MKWFGNLLVILLPNSGNIDMRFGDKYKELRLSKKITQRQLAAELNIAASIYNRFEKTKEGLNAKCYPNYLQYLLSQKMNK